MSYALMFGSAGLFVATTASAYKVYFNRDIQTDVNRIRTIEDVVAYVQYYGKMYHSCDALMEAIVTNVHMNNVQESTCATLYELYMEWRDDLGMRGFAINSLYASIICVASEDAWEFPVLR